MPERRRIYSVGALLAEAADALEDAIGPVWVEGEVFEYRGPHRSGHYYFKLREEDCSVDVKLWRSVAPRALQCALEEGRQVLAHGRFDVWPRRGTLSFLLDWVEDRGAGDLARRFEELKRRLQEEGLFAPERKRALPPRPRRVVVVCGRDSAAEADVLRTLEESAAPLHVLMRHARVQGEGAAAELVQALGEAAAVGADAVLLTRGGGSLEDLWAFNEEPLVRAVADCPVPVISAVGHETDFTLCDFVADLRAITPTAGAGALVRGWMDARATVAALGDALADAVSEDLRGRRMRLQRAWQAWQDQAPARRLHRARLALSEAERRFAAAGERGLRRTRARSLRAARRLLAAGPAAGLRLRRAHVHALGERLDAGDPRALLQRGYALVSRRGEPGYLRRAADASEGEVLRVQLARGELDARVEEVRAGDRDAPA